MQKFFFEDSYIDYTFNKTVLRIRSLEYRQTGFCEREKKKLLRVKAKKMAKTIFHCHRTELYGL